ncbi:MAG: hypothetical protein IT342_14240 [Candidatus Melainabacteria bacterium]|nr:hypothetical protein [Candidatus Melainabacteria bacterium]
MTTTKSNPVTGCIDTADGGNDHQLQLWIERNQGGFAFVIRSQYQPKGRLVRRCALDSGSTNANYGEVVAAGRAAFDKAKAPAA